MASTTGTTNDGSNNQRLRIDLSAGSLVTILVALFAAGVAITLTNSARQILSWIVACAVVAALIELVVQWLDKYMSRVLAIILVLLTIGAIAGSLAFGVMSDLDHEVHRLQLAAPEAAHDLENSKRFGNAAREAHLEERVTAAVDRLKAPSSGLAGQAVSSVTTYIVCIVLTILFLSWGPRVVHSGISQLEPDKQERVREVGESAFVRARRYVSLALLQAICVGILGFIICKAIDLPAAAPLALALSLMTLIPSIGILIGSLPILLLSAGLASSNEAIVVTIFFIALQIASILLIQPRIVRISNLYVGPSIITIGFLAGFELYGIGGAIYAAALFVLGIAALDAANHVEDEEGREAHVFTKL